MLSLDTEQGVFTEIRLSGGDEWVKLPLPYDTEEEAAQFCADYNNYAGYEKYRVAK